RGVVHCGGLPASGGFGWPESPVVGLTPLGDAPALGVAVAFGSAACGVETFAALGTDAPAFFSVALPVPECDAFWSGCPALFVPCPEADAECGFPAAGFPAPAGLAATF